MKACQFCDIAQHKKEAFLVYENDSFLVFLDKNPRARGHCLVIPKQHYRWVDDVPRFGDYFETAKLIGTALKKAFNADWVQYFTIGEAEHHAHIHVLPRYKNDTHPALPSLSHTENYSDNIMSETAMILQKEITAKKNRGGGVF